MTISAVQITMEKLIPLCNFPACVQIKPHLFEGEILLITSHSPQSATCVCDTLTAAWKSAATASSNSALKDLRRGDSLTLDMARMSKMAGHHAAITHSIEFTRDGPNVGYLQGMAGVIGNPTTITTLKNRKLVNARSMPSAGRNFREANNRLITNASSDGDVHKKHAHPVRNGPLASTSSLVLLILHLLLKSIYLLQRSNILIQMTAEGR